MNEETAASFGSSESVEALSKQRDHLREAGSALKVCLCQKWQSPLIFDCSALGLHAEAPQLSTGLLPSSQ
jgi:hypothetical protein